MFMKRIRMTVSAFLAAVFAACALVMPVSADIGEALLAGESVPLLVVITSFDPNGNGVDDFCAENIGSITENKESPMYGEQWAGTHAYDYYDMYFGDAFVTTSGEVSDKTLKNYYKAMSFNQFYFTPAEFDVVPDHYKTDERYGGITGGILEITLNMPHPEAYYNQIGDNQKAAYTIQRMIVEACDPYVDFSKFDTDGSGVVDSSELGLIILNAGIDHSSGNPTTQYKFQVHGTAVTFGTTSAYTAKCDGVRICHRSNIGEYYSSGVLMPIGTPAHELAHNIGTEDLYNRGGGSIGAWPMPNRFSLQCSGNYLGNPKATSPALLDPYNLMHIGWLEPETVGDGVHTLYSPTSGNRTLLKILTPDPQEYYLVEIRLARGFEDTMKNVEGGGVLIWHIDEDVNEEFYLDGLADSSATKNGQYHDPGIYPCFRNAYNRKTGLLKDTIPADPCYYLSSDDKTALFDSSTFISPVSLKSCSLFSVPDGVDPDWKLEIEVLTPPGEMMQIRVNGAYEVQEP